MYHIPESIDFESKRLIQKLLVLDPTKRPRAAELALRVAIADDAKVVVVAAGGTVGKERQVALRAGLRAAGLRAVHCRRFDQLSCMMRPRGARTDDDERTNEGQGRAGVQAGARENAPSARGERGGRRGLRALLH